MRSIDLETAVGEIRQAREESKRRKRPSPFFFMVGAGISHPPIPLASEIETQCKEIARQYERTDAPTSDDPVERYSHWFLRAYPQAEQRQRYLRDLMENAFISRANFRLAHLMLEETVTNLVVTTNFDDLLSRALTLFGCRHVVCDHPRTVERIDLQSDDLQIIHVHGTYWFYDCCNLKQEIADRAQPSLLSSFTMAALLDGILRDRSPLVIGYSGWDGDIFMSALRRRMSVGLRNNLYWFCHRRDGGLPNWLAEDPNVCVVLPPELKPVAPVALMTRPPSEVGPAAPPTDKGEQLVSSMAESEKTSLRIFP